MSKKKKLVFLFAFIVINMFLLIGFLVIRDAVLENRLKKEILALTELDITKDRYNLELKSSGDYALVEQTIKEYLDNYAIYLQNVLSIIKDPAFTSLLSISNYISDGPNFSVSISYIEAERKEFNENISQLIHDCDLDVIKEYIYTVTKDPYFVHLYQELMLDENMANDFSDTRKLLEDTKTRVNAIFDTSKEVFLFLRANSGAWKIENSQIKFETEELLKQYNAYIAFIHES